MSIDYSDIKDFIKVFIKEIEKLKEADTIKKFKEDILRIASKYDSSENMDDDDEPNELSPNEKAALSDLKTRLKDILKKDKDLVSKLKELLQNDPYYPVLKENANILMDIQVKDLYYLLQNIQRLNAINAENRVLTVQLTERKYMKYKNKYLKLKESLL